MTNQLLWQADPEDIAKSRLQEFRDFLRQKGVNVPGEDYEALHQWSITNSDGFWCAIHEFFALPGSIEKPVVHGEMPHATWFHGVELNYAQEIFSKNADRLNDTAILFRSERVAHHEVSWVELRDSVANLAYELLDAGVSSGDRVCGFVPNIPEATIAMLASTSIGAIWSSCSPDFGADSVLDRFSQIEPKVIFAVDGYQYGGKSFSRTAVVEQICNEISSLQLLISIDYLAVDQDFPSLSVPVVAWSSAISGSAVDIPFVTVAFDHPLWVLYSSGTTGKPKAIVHGHGGILLEHVKYLALHNDVHAGERFFWFSTTGWMMWNYIHGALLLQSTVVLYDGSPGYPNINALWDLAEDFGIEHFGVSAPFLTACMKRKLEPGKSHALDAMRTISSTGAPLPAEVFSWIYECVKRDVWLCSMSGGTDVCTAFVGGCIEKPVYRGEIQSRALGCDLVAYDSEANTVVDKVGELVVRQPMPSMPVFFWNDEDGSRYFDSYFAQYPGVWRHGDWISINSRGSLTIHGRSDSTLNRQGVRIGTAEIYRALLSFDQIADALIIHLDNNRDFMPLFLVLTPGSDLTDELTRAIKHEIRRQLSPRHVPDVVLSVPEIPYTISGKKMETPVKRILSGCDPQQVLNPHSMKNPGAIDTFIALAARI